MKKQIIISFLTLVSFSAFCQRTLSLDFDNTANFNHLLIDSNSVGVWKIGTPNKVHFKSAHSGSRAIITDTILGFPKNSISKFVVKDIPFKAKNDFKYSMTFSYMLD